MQNHLVSFSILIAQGVAHGPEPESTSPSILSGPFILGLVLGIVIGALAALVFKMSRNKGESARSFVPVANPSPPKAIEQTVKSAGQQIKSCPTCHSTYTDESLAYCVSDGATLVVIGHRPPTNDPNPTVLYPPARQTD